MGVVLIVIGIGWAALGVMNLVSGLQRLDEQGFGDAGKGFALIFNMAFLIVPGLMLAGLGVIVRRQRRRAMASSSAGSSASAAIDQRPPVVEDIMTKKCPECAETIKLRAVVCRFCQYRFDPAEVQRPHRSDFGRPCCFRPFREGSAFGVPISRPHPRSLSLRPGDSHLPSRKACR